MLETDRENLEEELRHENDDTIFLDRPISKVEVLLAIKRKKEKEKKQAIKNKQTNVKQLALTGCWVNFLSSLVTKSSTF